MKRFISFVILIAVLVSLCACGKKGQEANTAPVADAATEPTLALDSPEAMYGHIDQTQPIDGVHKIWNVDGIQFMMENPANKYELLCNVDMGGAVLAPVAEFTGEINGANFTISNFTLQGGSEESFGFVTVNKGKLSNLYLDKVTYVPGANAKNIGAYAGINEGTITRSILTAATMNVEAAPADASIGFATGINTGTITNSRLHLELSVKATGTANVGTLVGTAQGGKIEYLETEGKMDITGGNVTAGMFAGIATDVVFQDCKFLCETNTVDGKLITVFTGNEDNELVTCDGALYRDNAAHEPLTEGQNKLRDRVVLEMNNMGTVEWRLHNDLEHSCVCSLSICHGLYNSTTLYKGIPYNHKGGSLSRMYYMMDEEGYVKDWAYGLDPYDGFDLYMGNDCSTALAHAWWTVSNSTDFYRCTYEVPQLVGNCNVATGEENSGVLKVGNYNSDFALASTHYTDKYMEVNGEQGMYEAYACLRKGDGYVYMIPEGGHTRMAAQDAVVVRDQHGNISGAYSYVISTEQGSTTRADAGTEGAGTDSDVFSSWKVNYKYTFANLFYDWAIPITCEELVSGEMEPATCEMLGAVEGYMGMFNGTVKGNYYLDNVDLEIKNSKGEVVFFHTMWTTADKRHDIGHNDGLLRNYKDDYDMVGFSVPLSKFQFQKGETYSYTVTAHLHTYDDFVVHESSFTYGKA